MTNTVSPSGVVAPGCGYAAVLVDVVDSRRHPDRAALQAALARSAGAVNERVAALDPLTATIGDELQATYAALLPALTAATRLRLELAAVTAVRVAIGWGDIVVHDPDRRPFGQDGSAWWAARAALDRISRPPARGRPRFGLAVEVGAPAVEATPRGGLPAPRPLDVAPIELVHRHVVLVDRALAALDPVEAAIVLGDLDRRPTAEIAAAVGISQSAVSQRRRRNSLRSLVAALEPGPGEGSP